MSPPMHAVRVQAILKEDGTLTLDHLPFQAGVLVEVIVMSRSAPKTGDPYPFRGQEVHYERPFDPVAEDDWEVLK